jgi:hypothetical protein
MLELPRVQNARGVENVQSAGSEASKENIDCTIISSSSNWRVAEK